MNRFSSFLIGIFLGALLMFVGLKYAIVRAGDGFHVIGKSTARLSTVYIDIREYTAADWKDHISLATDIANSNNTALQEEVTRSAMDNSIDSLWNQWQPTSP